MTDFFCAKCGCQSDPMTAHEGNILCMGCYAGMVERKEKKDKEWREKYNKSVYGRQ